MTKETILDLHLKRLEKQLNELAEESKKKPLTSGIVAYHADGILRDTKHLIDYLYKDPNAGRIKLKTMLLFKFDNFIRNKLNGKN